MNTEPLNLLLIEDDAYDMKVIRLMIVSQRDKPIFNVRTGESLAQGLVLMAERAAEVVLLDLNLPDSTGLDTFTAFHNAFPHTPVIIISGTDDLALAVEAVQAGAQDYLLKGEMSRNLLVRAIHHAVERQAILRTLERRTRELADSESRLRMITDKSADGIVIVAADGNVHFANPAAVRMLDFVEVPEIDRVFPHPLPGDGSVEMTVSPADGGEPLTVEIDAVAIEWDAEQVYLVILRDITARKRVEVELQQAKDTLESVVKARTSELKKANQYLLDQISERRRAQRQLNRALAEAEQARDQIDTIFASVADGLLATDRYNRITMINRAAEEILGVTWGNVIGQPVDAVINNATLLNRILTTLETGRELQFEFEIPFRQGDNAAELQTKIIRARSAMVKDRAHTPGGVITAMYDVTREREVDRLKAEFISTAAHELRTPLTTVQGFSEILLARDDIPIEAQKKYLSYINNQALALARIVDDLLDIARFESGQKFVLNKEPANIRMMVEAVVAKFQTQSDAHQFVVQLKDGDSEWVVDPQKMTQVLENLLGNAVKFAPDGGQVEVNGQSYQDPQSGGSFYFISVKDDGVGMTLAQVAHIFDQFYRGDASNTAVGGTGLGMAIVKHIIEAHGGRVWVDSKPGNGTKVSFTVPLE